MLAAMPVDMVVNNAGLAHYMPFADLPAAQAAELVDLNVLAPVAADVWLGCTPARHTRHRISWRSRRGPSHFVPLSVMADPGGNEFCVCRAVPARH